MKTIAVIGGTWLLDPNIYTAFLLMNQNLDVSLWANTEYHFSNAYPLRYPFAGQPVRLCELLGGSHIYRHLKTLLPISDGVIMSLAGRILDLEYLNSPDGFFPDMLKRIVQIVSETNLPIVYAIEDNKDTFEPIYVDHNLRDGGRHSEIIEKPPSSIVVEDDIWDASSQTMRTIRHRLNIPKSVPIIPYTYRKPITIQGLMIRILAEIDAC